VRLGGAALPAPTRVRLPLGIALLAGAVAIVAVLAVTSSRTTERAAPTGTVLLHGLPLQSANCAAWWAADEGERVAVIQALTRSIGGPTPYGPGTTLSDARVRRLFDTVCAPTFTSHFLLYEIYVRAAGFKSLGG
jgi:hypothetical protein